jgi:hypothetical protein
LGNAGGINAALVGENRIIQAALNAFLGVVGTLTVTDKDYTGRHLQILSSMVRQKHFNLFGAVSGDSFIM